MISLFGIIVFTAISASNGQQPCTTSLGTQGSCININGCRPLLTILRSTGPLQARDRDTLAKSQCGVDGDVPKVCCPNDGQTTRVTTAASTSAPNQVDVTNHPNLRLLRNDLCGVTTEGRIYGGNKTSVLEFTWMAMIGYTVGRSQEVEFKCGGSVISNRYVLTAAHCVTGLNYGVRLAKVRLGEHDIGKKRDCDYEKGVEIVCADEYQEFSIDRAHVLASYRTPTLGNDVALIRLNRDVDFGKNNVKPICLPIGDAAMFESTKGIVTGWGLNETKKFSESLLKVKLPIVPNVECARTYKERYNINVFGNQICAGGKVGQDSCQGDSGGPLQSPAVSSGRVQYVQYGIVSYGPADCGTLGVPGVYTQVAEYMKWILDTIEE